MDSFADERDLKKPENDRYTFADYTASNTCYEKIGYVLKGKLCTIGGI